MQPTKSLSFTSQFRSFDVYSSKAMQKKTRLRDYETPKGQWQTAKERCETRKGRYETKKLRNNERARWPYPDTIHLHHHYNYAQHFVN